MKDEGTSGLDAAQVERQRFARQQVNRDRIPDEGVYQQPRMALPRGLALQAEACIADCNAHVGRAVGQEAEPAAGDAFDAWINLIEGDLIALLEVGGNCARAKAYDAHTRRPWQRG